MKNQKLKNLVMASLFAALTATATYVVRIPVPAINGYINLGDCFVLLGAFWLGPVYGMLAGAIGSTLADIIAGYPIYAPATFVIKGLCALFAALIYRRLGKEKKLSPVIGAVVAEIFMVIGYFGFAATVMGYGLAAAASIPTDLIQAAVGVILSCSLLTILKRLPKIR